MDNFDTPASRGIAVPRIPARLWGLCVSYSAGLKLFCILPGIRLQAPHGHGEHSTWAWEGGVHSETSSNYNQIVSGPLGNNGGETDLPFVGSFVS